MGLKSLIIAILAAPSFDLPVSGPSSADTAQVAAIDAVVASATLEWSAAFAPAGRTYVAPRVIYLRVPKGHPARGTGYSPGVGLTVDLADMDAITAEFGADARTLVALIVAHELGHHVQFLLSGSARPAADPRREQQADCYAGWWLATANARAGVVHYSVPSLDQQVPELFRLLSRDRAANSEFATSTHGATADRIAAFGRGLAATGPNQCTR